MRLLAQSALHNGKQALIHKVKAVVVRVDIVDSPMSGVGALYKIAPVYEPHFFVAGSGCGVACALDEGKARGGLRMERGYQNTRRFVLSKENPYYNEGALAKGVGSPHTPKGYIWPIALCVQAMTSTDTHEIAHIVNVLMNTHAGTGFMHESFDPDHPEQFTRSWFAWANSMFGDLIYRLHEDGRLAEVLKLAAAE